MTSASEPQTGDMRPRGHSAICLTEHAMPPASIGLHTTNNMPLQTYRLVRPCHRAQAPYGAKQLFCVACFLQAALLFWSKEYYRELLRLLFVQAHLRETESKFTAIGRDRGALDCHWNANTTRTTSVFVARPSVNHQGLKKSVEQTRNSTRTSSVFAAQPSTKD